jgi:WD40 repeat protein
MKRTTPAVALASIALAVSAVPSAALAAPSSPFAPAAPAASADRSSLLDRIELPDGWLPEGITTDGRSLFSGSRADGAIQKIDPGTGRRKTFKGAAGRIAVGLDHDSRRDVLWVAGGAGKEVRAQDADTGKVLRTYRFPSAGNRFVNDVTVTRTAVYATDSLSRELLVVPLSTRTDALPATRRARTLPLKGDLKLAAGNNLNGIVSTRGTLVAVQSNTGRLFRIDARTGRTTKVVTGGTTFVNGDGLEPGPGGTLYVVQNRDNRIRVLSLASKARSAKVVDTIGRRDFATEIDVPSTVALLKGSLFAVNARFGTPAPETAAYWISRAPAR